MWSCLRERFSWRVVGYLVYGVVVEIDNRESGKENDFENEKTA